MHLSHRDRNGDGNDDENAGRVGLHPAHRHPQDPHPVSGHSKLQEGGFFFIPFMTLVQGELGKLEHSLGGDSGGGKTT